VSSQWLILVAVAKNIKLAEITEKQLAGLLAATMLEIYKGTG